MRLRKQAAKLESIRWATSLRDVIAVVRLTRAWVTDAPDFPPLAPIKDHATKLLNGTSWEKLLYCPWCVSFWVAGAVLVLRKSKLWAPLGDMLAASQIAGTLIELEDRYYA